MGSGIKPISTLVWAESHDTRSVQRAVVACTDVGSRFRRVRFGRGAATQNLYLALRPHGVEGGSEPALGRGPGDLRVEERRPRGLVRRAAIHVVGRRRGR